MKKSKRVFLILLSVFLLAAFVTGCSKQQSEAPVEDGENSEVQYVEELIVTAAAAPTDLDPNATTQNASRRFTSHIYEPLVKFDQESKTVIPWLAESWDQPADNEYIFHLRKDVKFHNGETLNAEDVKFTYERCMQLPAAVAFVEQIEKIEAVDDLTLKIILKDPSPTFLGNITHDVTAIIKKDQDKNFDDKPNGTNAYMMVEYKVDDYMLFERFDDYWGGVKPTKTIRMRIVPDNNARNLAVEAGDVDIGIQVTNADYSALKNNPKVTILDVPSILVEFFAMNVTKPPFDDVHARRAVAYAFNKEQVIDGIYEGDALNAKSFINETAFGYDPDVKSYEYNVEKAKEELAKSKYPNGFKFKCYTTASRGRYTEALQYDLSIIGIDMEVEFVQNIASAINTGYEGAHITSVSYPAYDADIIYRYLHSTTHGAGGNLSWYSNTEMDKLLESTKTEIDAGKRFQIFKDIQQLMYEEAINIPILTRIVKAATVEGVGGFKPDPATIDNYVNAYKVK